MLGKVVTCERKKGDDKDSKKRAMRRENLREPYKNSNLKLFN